MPAIFRDEEPERPAQYAAAAADVFRRKNSKETTS
jgi:hypothetical protein